VKASALERRESELGHDKDKKNGSEGSLFVYVLKCEVEEFR